VFNAPIASQHMRIPDPDAVIIANLMWLAIAAEESQQRQIT
jgi:hypothetical protein